MDNFHESYELPSGLKFDFYADPVKEYGSTLRNIKEQEELDAFVNRWKYLCKELKGQQYKVELLQDAIANDRAYVEKAQNGDKEAFAYCCLLIPPCLAVVAVKAYQFHVTPGLVLLQLLNHNMVEIDSEGYWTFYFNGKTNNDS